MKTDSAVSWTVLSVLAAEGMLYHLAGGGAFLPP